MKRIAALIISMQLIVTTTFAQSPIFYSDTSLDVSDFKTQESSFSCSEEQSLNFPSIEKETKDSIALCAATLEKYGLPNDLSTEFNIKEILPMIGGCLSGGGQAIKDEWEAIKFLVDVIIDELPSFLWKSVKSFFSDDGDISPIAAADKASEINESIFEKAHRLATEYYDIFKKFLGQIWDYAKNEYQEFFCLPKVDQARILCRLVSNGFLMVFSPTKFIQGAKWTAQTANATKQLLAAALQATRASSKLANRINEAATLLAKSAEKFKVISKLDDGIEIVSKQVGDDTVYYLQTLYKGEKITRELVLDQHSKMFSINGQGKKVIDLLIDQGAKNGNGAAILLDVNNLGKVNYFSKGLTSGDEYISAVSDVIRETIKDLPEVRAFRTGGDELTLFSNGLSKDEVFKLSKKINDNVLKDSRVQKIFIEEKETVARQLAEAKAAKDANAIKELSVIQSELAKMDGSITVGSRMIQKGDDYSSIQTVINDALSPAKATYKKEIGMPYEKYGATLSDVKIEKIDGKVAPPVLPPR